MKNKMKDFEKNIKKPSRLEKIEKLLYPKNIAVIGASNKFASVGNEIMQRLISFNFSGEIFPISLKEEKILNKKCYKSVLDVNKKIDLAVIAVPAPTVLKVIDECYQAKIESVVVISSGFKEIGEAGRELENKLLEKIKKYKMVMVGPNCLGVLNTHQKISMNASFSPDNPARVGKIGFASQSGALGSGIINTLTQTNLGLGQFVSLGNGADITALDLIEFWEKDDNINLIMLYMESLPNMKKFREVCTRVGAKKPIVVIKSGRSSVGARATASHTGSLAGDDVTTSSILASSGVIRELNLRDLVVTARALSLANLPKGENLAIITNAGGPGILASDSAEDEGIPLANLKDETKTKLRKILAPQASVNNPVDVIASASLEQITGATEILLKTEEVDIVLVIYLYITQQNDTALTLELEKLKEKYPNKSIVAMFMTTSDFSNRFEKTKENQVLTERNKIKDKGNLSVKIPIYDYPVDAIHAIKRLIERKRNLEQPKKTKKFEFDEKTISNIIENAKNKNIKLISTLDSLKIFKAMDLPVVKFNEAKTFQEAKKIAKNIGYPLVLKISSDTISHKTDVNGVITNIQNEKELKKEWQNLFLNLEKNKIKNQINSIVVMEQVKAAGRELVAGIASKEEAGKLAMFGIGGIFIETLKEVAFRPCPLKLSDAEDLVLSTKAKDLMGSVRGYKPANLEEMASILLKLSQLVESFKDIAEVDANPIMIDKNGNIALVDARIVLN